MANLLETPFPVGTPKELEDAGINPHVNGSCAPVDNEAGIKGCSYYETCVFTQAHAAGKVKPIRDNGPKNIGYSIHLSEWGPERPANEDWMPCHRFMATMFMRMVHGETVKMRDPNKARDEIKIIANEDEVIWLHHQVSKYPGENKRVGLETKDTEFRIPKHERPGQLLEVKGAAAEIARKRDMERAMLDEPKGKKSA